jgi:hypothetical protein
MIDKEVFAQGMGQLAGAFGREVDGPVSKMYHQVLSPHLTDAQFVEAVTRTVASETFWPSPATILEKAGVSPQQRSEGVLRMVNDALFKHGGFKFLPTEISMAWDTATWAAIREVGGLAAITNCTEEKWPAMQRKFQRAYEAATSPKPSVTDGRTPATKQLVARTSRDLALPNGDRD